MPASNTREAIRALIGQRVVGALFEAMPPNRPDLQAGTWTLVFEDGKGFTVGGNGSYWWESVKDVARAIRLQKDELRNAEQELRGVLELAGVLHKGEAE